MHNIKYCCVFLNSSTLFKKSVHCFVFASFLEAILKNDAFKKTNKMFQKLETARALGSACPAGNIHNVDDVELVEATDL